MPIPTRVVAPTSAGRLAHPVGAAITSPGRRYLAAASSESTRISVFSAVSKQLRELDVRRRFDCLTLSMDSQGELLAVVERGSHQLCVFDVAKDDVAVVEQATRSVACLFDARERLWAIRVTPEGFVIELRAPGTWELLASGPFSNSYFAAGGAHLLPGAPPGSVLVETYSGPE